MAPVRHRSRGATLLEVLTVTALSALVMAVAVPNLRTLAGPWTLRSAATQVAADLQGARLRAIAQNVRFRVAFDEATDTYRLERETLPNTFVADGAVQPLPAGATLGTVNPGDPVFDTRGMLAATVTIPVSVAGTGTQTVTTNVLGETTID